MNATSINTNINARNTIDHKISIRKKNQVNAHPTQVVQRIKDNVNYSPLGRLLSAGSRELSSAHKLRPEVVKRFMNIAKSTETIPDNTIDTIFKKMLDA